MTDPEAVWREALDRHGLRLRRVGARYRGPCPIHGGANATSFVVTPGRGFYCHACGAGGGLAVFERLISEMPPQGDGRASEASGASRVPPRWRSRYSQSQDQRRTERFDEVLPLGPLDPSHGFLLKRGIGAATARSFDCGFYTGPGPFSGRVVFPIHDADGRLVGHVGRAIVAGQEPRYRVSEGLPKGQLLYHANRVHGDVVVVVEGPFDALAVHRAGCPDVVALLGCRASAQQLAQLRAFRRVRILLDADDAGRAGAAFLAAALGEMCAVEVLCLAAGDPAGTPEAELQALVGGSAG